MSYNQSQEDMRIYIAALEAELQLERQRRQLIESSTFWRLSLPLRKALTPLSLLRKKLAEQGWRSLLKKTAVPTLGMAGTSLLTPAFSDGSVLAFICFNWEQYVRPCDTTGSTDTRRLTVGFRILQILNSEGQVLANLDFRQSAGAYPHICYGMGYAEPWGTWNVGLRSVLMVWLPSSANELTLKIDASLPDGLTQNSAVVSLNDRSIGTITIGGAEAVELQFSMPDNLSSRSAIPHENLSNVPQAQPEISIIILNYNKPFITLAAVEAIEKSTDLPSYEIIVLDNGSNSESWHALRALDLPVRLIRLKENRYFGEGNNIAAEEARANVLLFLNNDAFVHRNTIGELYRSLLNNRDAGAVGPIFKYPDGELQEAGAFLTSQGIAYQRGKSQPDFDLSKLSAVEPVDYISAACLGIRRNDFMALGGFDLRYDPAYYEDSDLCLRLMATGKKTLLVTSAVVTHIENATTSDPANASIAQNIVERHRQIFLSRWSRWLENRLQENLPAIELIDVKAADLNIERGGTSSPINAVYTPFPLVPGGGERYLLGTALALNQLRPTAVVTPGEYSNCRVNTLLHELGYPAGQLFATPERELMSKDVETFVLMGNETFPTRRGYGEYRIFHCQFPFPSAYDETLKDQGITNLSAYDLVVVNSNFTAQTYRNKINAHGVKALPVQVIYPPVKTLCDQIKPLEKENVILSIGRFTKHGHAKRQDVIIQAFIALVKSQVLVGWKLHLCGSVPNDKDSVEYYESLKKQAQGFNIIISISPSRAQMEDSLMKAKVYVSATGFGVTKEEDFWLCEHFGITLVEAASAGCIPVGYHLGGPPEIIERLRVGHTFKSAKDLQRAIIAATIDAEDLSKREQLIQKSRYFDESRFFDEWTKIVGTLQSRKISKVSA